MSTLAVNNIKNPSAGSAAFVLNTDGSVTFGPNVSVGSFAAGTIMLFQQTAAPTGWTKLTTHDDKALRVVSGAVGSGGTNSFSAVLNGSVGATTLTTAQMPSHTHGLNRGASPSNGGVVYEAAGSGTLTSLATGGGGSHTHSMSVQYVDVIFASKN